MPPHCDSLDGPVVAAARNALETGDENLVLPYVPAEGEDEVRHAFERVMVVRDAGPEIRDLADRWFFETVVRVHRAGEGAPFTGLKPAGLDTGPVIPAAEHALASGQADQVADVLCSLVRREVERRLGEVLALRAQADRGLPAARSYVEAMLGFEVWAHGVYKQIVASAHGHGSGHQHR